jgi:hypothetical protein
MSHYLDTTGNPTLGIGLCARCSRKFALAELSPDPNYPALMVCRDDIDQYDPYRLAPRAPDQIVLPFVRPDVSIATAPAGFIAENGDLFVTTDGSDQRYITL